MRFTLNDIVPWGRSFEEYLNMFGLTESDLKKTILDCGAGPSSFNCEMTKMGYKVVSSDPLYSYGREEIKRRIDETYKTVLEQTILNKDKFIWKTIKSPEELGKVRMAAMKKFLDDFQEGKVKGRYIPESLPTLSFKDKQFDLALSSHFLFLYTEHLSFDFHLKSIYEMCRAAREARIFPIVNLDGTKSPYIQNVVSGLGKKGLKATIKKVNYEFQCGANEMLSVVLS